MRLRRVKPLQCPGICTSLIKDQHLPAGGCDKYMQRTAQEFDLFIKFVRSLLAIHQNTINRQVIGIEDQFVHLFPVGNAPQCGATDLLPFHIHLNIEVKMVYLYQICVR